MSFYSQMQSLADRMLRKYGAVVTLTRTTQGAYSSATSTTGSPTTTVTLGTAVRENYSIKEVDGTRIKDGDVRLIVSPKTRGGAAFPEPAPSTDVLSFGGRNYTVVSVDPWSYNGAENVGFAVQARGIA